MPNFEQVYERDFECYRTLFMWKGHARKIRLSELKRRVGGLSKPMNSKRPRLMLSRGSVLLRSVALLALTVLTPAAFAQLPGVIPVKNWSVSTSSGQEPSSQ